MIRRHRPADRLVVDLGAFGEAGTDGPGGHADDEPDDLAPSRDEAHDDPADRRPVRSRRRRIVEGVAAGAVVVVALAAWGTTTAVREHERVEHLAGARGGVLSLAQAPVERWSADTESADTTVVMPGLVVVRRGTVLHALDAANGTERWQVPIGGDPYCGTLASGHGAITTVDPLVCWSGPNAGASTVTVVHADGSSATRTLDDDVVWAAGTADGGLVTMRMVGPTPPAPSVVVTPDGSGFWNVEGTITQGQDADVRLEDATTGDVRWRHTVPFKAGVDASTCGYPQVDDDGTAATYVQRMPSVFDAGYLVVQGCGVDSAFTLAGDAIPVSDVAFLWSGEPYVDGGLLTQVAGYQGDDTVASVLTGPDGGSPVAFHSQVLDPWATDGSSSDLVLTGSAGVPLAAYGRDGTERWHADHTYSTLLVRAAGVAVLDQPDGVVCGVDLATGAILWTDKDLVAATADDVGTDVSNRMSAAFTDGTTAALAISGDDSTLLVGLDLATGAVRWRSSLPDDHPQLVAADGRLVEVVAQMNGSIARDEDGELVNRSPGTVHAFG